MLEKREKKCKADDASKSDLLVAQKTLEDEERFRRSRLQVRRLQRKIRHG